MKNQRLENKLLALGKSFMYSAAQNKIVNTITVHALFSLVVRSYARTFDRGDILKPCTLKSETGNCEIIFKLIVFSAYSRDIFFAFN